MTGSVTGSMTVTRLCDRLCDRFCDRYSREISHLPCLDPLVVRLFSPPLFEVVVLVDRQEDLRLSGPATLVLGLSCLALLRHL